MEKSGNAAALPEKVFGGDNCGDLCLRGDISTGPPAVRDGFEVYDLH